MIAAALLLAGTAVCGAGAVDPATLTDADVQASMRAIVEALYARKDPKRFWDPPSWNDDTDGQPSQTGGYTPLAVLALLYAGESYQDPRLRDAIEHLEQVQLKGTYAVAVRAHVWALLPQRFEPMLKADTQWLLGAFQPHVGGWGYDARPRSGWYDNSLTQYGALGLWEAAKRGVPIDPQVWGLIENRFLDDQFADGGWSYHGGHPQTGSMTAAGLTALFITQDLLHVKEAVTIDPARAAPNEQAIARGLAWMDRSFSAGENPGRDSNYFYYLYGVERVGMASGYKTFGGHDWFREGAARIIERLCDRGGDGGTWTVADRPIRQLAFGLMFLSRGRVPVAINKLRVPGMAWNSRPRDVANLTGWISREAESALSWQIVDAGAPPESWLDAPVLYLASSQRLPWETSGALAGLKRYLDLGGLLLAVNEGRSPDFSRSVIQAGETMYPQYRWRPLRRDHWAYSLLWRMQGRPPVLKSLSNGVRDLIILSPGGDLAAEYQVRSDQQPAFAAAANVYLYASEMNRPRPRLSAPAAAPAPALPASGGTPVTIVHARHDGNWNPEPLALHAFAGAVARDHGLDVRIVEHPLSELGSLQPRPDLVVVNDVEALDFTADQRRTIADWVHSGGVILFETPGGRGAFARSAREQCAQLLGQPAAHAGDLDAVAVRYRPYAIETLGVHDATPRLDGISIDDKGLALFCDLDITFGLLDEPCWGVAGYTPESARRLLHAILEKGTKARRHEGTQKEPSQ